MVVFPASRAAWPSRAASFRAVSSGDRSGCPAANRRLRPVPGKVRRDSGRKPRTPDYRRGGTVSPEKRRPIAEPARGTRPLSPPVRVRRTILPFPGPGTARREACGRPPEKGRLSSRRIIRSPPGFCVRSRKALLPRRTSLIVVLTADRGAIAGHRGLWRRPGRLRSAGVPAFRNVAPRMSTDDSCAPAIRMLSAGMRQSFLFPVGPLR